MCRAQTIALVCRQRLFREHVARFSICENRRPTLDDVRRIWTETGFRTV